MHHNPIDSAIPVSFDARKVVREGNAEDEGDIEMTNENLSDEEERKF